jgi:hypothetical protein
MPVVSGEFEVKMTPEALSATAAAAAEGGLGRMALDKRYHGALDAAGTGEMLACLDRAIMSGGYVAMELVRGALDGRAGSFLLQHHGVMARGAPGLTVTVVADSGRGQLAGLAGQMAIRVEGGKHYYDFDYTLADAAIA